MKYESKYWRNIFTRIALIAISVLVIVWFMPRNEAQRMKYDIGKPWMYGSFIAKFDFPIYKTDENIKSEQDSMLKHFEPYYNFNMNIARNEIAKFKNDFKSGVEGMPIEYINIIANKLQKIYQTGIINTPEYSSMARDTANMVRVVVGKQARSVQINKVYSTMTAYEELLKDKELAKYRLELQKCNLTDYIAANLTYDKSRCNAERNDLLGSIPLASGMVMSGQKIIDRGEIIDEYTYRVLSSFEREMQRRNATVTEITSTLIGQIMYVTILITLLTIYLGLFRQDYFSKPRSIMMLYSIITIFPVLVSIMMVHNIFSVYIIPFAMVPIFVRVFMDSRTAFIAHATMVLICAAAVKYQYEFIIIQLVAGLIAIYSLREMSKRAQVFKTALLVNIGSIVVYFALQMIQNNDVLKMDHDMYLHFVFNGIFLLLAYPLMYLIERTFGFVSDVSLFELSNTNRGILRDLSEIAPGTFQHSITVGNLATEIANKIGAQSLLVRTGALYHDIGKILNPVFFTENQAGVNPHNNMRCEESARIIISHVNDGVKLAEKYGLPNIIKDFILTHHGKSMAKYFYIKYKNEHPDEEFDEKIFEYPGPNPFTREQAILMMADTTEAASRSLEEYTEESISNMVNKLIDEKVSAGYFTECPITFRDISVAKHILIERLKAIYHTRIQYPELKKNTIPDTFSV